MVASKCQKVLAHEQGRSLRSVPNPHHRVPAPLLAPPHEARALDAVPAVGAGFGHMAEVLCLGPRVQV